MPQWTYLPQNIATVPLFQVRNLIGDTIQSDQQLFDEEINWQITQYTNIYGASAACCRSIAAKYARKVDTVQGELRIMYSAQTKRYNDMARDLEMRGLRGVVPYSGGIGIADKVNNASDPDRVPPEYVRHQFDDLLPVGPVGEQTPTPGSPDLSNSDGWGS